jgi:hypothetical protein
MADPVTNNYSLVLPTVGGDLNLWGGVLNNGVITAMDTILSGVLPVSVTSSDVTLTSAQFQNLVFALSGALTGNRSLIIPLSPNSATVACAGRFIVDNQTSGAFNVTVKTAAVGSTGVVVPQGLRTELYSDGTNVKYADDSKVYVVSVNGSPNGQLAGTAATVNNPPFPLAVDYSSKALWMPTTTGNSTTTVWQKFITNSSPIPTALFTQLVIKVVTNTTVSVAATGVSTTDGAGNYLIVVPNSTINMGTTGANALDTGAIAAAQWYSIWVIAKADGTTACLASLSATSPTMPSGYTYKSRVGWVRTAAGVAQLMGTWQFNRRAEYIQGLAQTNLMPLMVSGALGSNSTAGMVAVGVSTFVPTTADAINIYMPGQLNGGGIGSYSAGPNNNYSSISGNNPPPISNGDPTRVGLSGTIMLQSTNIYYYGGSGGNGMFCLGWEDNI